jgi:hypothetical protein
MIPLFGDPQPAGKRDILEGRLIWLALETLRLGTNVVLDFGPGRNAGTVVHVGTRNDCVSLRGAVAETEYVTRDAEPSAWRLAMTRRIAAGVLTAGLVTLLGPTGIAFADVGDAAVTPASCMGIEAAALSPPGSNEEASGGMRDIRAFLKEVAPGVAPGHAFYSVAAHLHQGSHESCDKALGG